MLELLFHSKVKNDLKKMDPPLVRQIQEKVLPDLQQNPDKGEPLTGSLQGILSYHFKFLRVEYRIAYVYQPKKKSILVLMIGKRENFYDALGRRNE